MHSFRIRELLSEMGRKQGRRVTMRELSAATNISPQVLSKMDDPGGYVTNTGYVEKLCRFFGVNPSKLFVFEPGIDAQPARITTQIDVSADRMRD